MTMTFGSHRRRAAVAPRDRLGFPDTIQLTGEPSPYRALEAETTRRFPRTLREAFPEDWTESALETPDASTHWEAFLDLIDRHWPALFVAAAALGASAAFVRIWSNA